ncbi:MAG: cysteine hydrolase [Desulfobacterales bacterium]|nr:MAG: cysteine hydrolase [Desulfobacterales bacterium]
MKPALIIVDMLKDTFEKHPEALIAKEGMTFVPTINRLSTMFREKGLPVIFSCDSFLVDDFIFQGKMSPHSIKGTEGANIIDQLNREPGDIVSEKRRFSAFFKTGIEQQLRQYGCDTVVVVGISTHICVLSTVIDAVSFDFNAVLLKDCCAAHAPDIHDSIIQIYENTPLYPLIRVMPSQMFIESEMETVQ